MSVASQPLCCFEDEADPDPCKVSVAEFELGVLLAEALQAIFTNLGRYEVEARLFFDEPRVLSSIAALFSQFINYLVRANFHFLKRNPVRSARAAFSPKLSQIWVSIERDKLDLDREIRTVLGTRLVRSSQDSEAEFLEQKAFRGGGTVPMMSKLYLTLLQNAEELFVESKLSTRKKNSLVRLRRSQYMRTRLKCPELKRMLLDLSSCFQSRGRGISFHSVASIRRADL